MTHRWIQIKRKSQIPNSKSQINSNDQNTNDRNKNSFGLLVIGIWVLFGAWCLVLGISISFAEEARNILTLDELIIEAAKNNPEIQAAQSRWQASLARVPLAKALDAPTVGLKFEKIPRGKLKLDKTMPEDRMLSLAQMIPLFGKLSLKGKIALIESQIYAAEYKNKELEVIKELKNVYYELFMNYKEIELSWQSLQLLEGIAKSAEARYGVGEISQAEVLKVHLEIAKLNNTIANLQELNLAKQTAINSLLNKKPDSSLGIPSLKEEASFKPDIATLYKQTLENQPELRIFAYAIERNKQSKALAQRSFFPDLMAELGLRGITAGAIGPWDLVLAINLPFWFWTKQRYAVKEAIINIEEAQAAYRAIENKARAKVRELVAEIEIAKNNIQLYKTNLLPLLESSIQSSLAAFRAGKADFMLLLDSERMLIENKMNYYKAIVEYNISLADLEKAVGKELKEQ